MNRLLAAAGLAAALAFVSVSATADTYNINRTPGSWAGLRLFIAARRLR